VGRLSFEDSRLVENAEALFQAVVRAKPAAAKGKYVKSIHVASTMGPGVAIDPAVVDARV
jgi:large subunit ribosomal protein L1